MEASLQVLLEGLIDYAGLFPPASLDMDSAVRNYAAYRQSAESRWLGRFVVPAVRLEEFDRAIAGLGPGSEGKTWRLSALIRNGRDNGGNGDDLVADLGTLVKFNRKGLEERGRHVVIDCLEMKAEGEEAILGAMEKVPMGITPY